MINVGQRRFGWLITERTRVREIILPIQRVKFRPGKRFDFIRRLFVGESVLSALQLILFVNAVRTVYGDCFKAIGIVYLAVFRVKDIGGTRFPRISSRHSVELLDSVPNWRLGFVFIEKNGCIAGPSKKYEDNVFDIT